MVSKREVLTWRSSLTRLPLVSESVARAAANNVARYNDSGSKSTAPDRPGADLNHFASLMAGDKIPGRLTTNPRLRPCPRSRFSMRSPHQRRASDGPSYCKKDVLCPG